MNFPEVTISLPGWVEKYLPDADHIYETVEKRMELAIELSRLNVEHGGGPFGAAIFDMTTRKLIAPGMNLVVPENCSMLHAEIVAITIAQKIKQTYDLGGEGMPACELVSSAEPCVMCMGAIIWSGIRHLVCGARDADARAAGFDEGPKTHDWVKAFNDRGISVERDVLRNKAADVLKRYADTGGIIYNARQNS